MHHGDSGEQYPPEFKWWAYNVGLKEMVMHGIRVRREA